MNLSNAIKEELLFSPNHIRIMQLLKVDYSYILQHRNRNAEKWRLFNFLKWVELYGVSE
jgi:hypothetical protein